MMGAGNDWPPPKPRVERVAAPGSTQAFGFELLEYSNGKVHAICLYGACPFSHWFALRPGSNRAVLEQAGGILDEHCRSHRPKRKGRKR